MSTVSFAILPRLGFRLGAVWIYFRQMPVKNRYLKICHNAHSVKYNKNQLINSH